MQIHLITIGQRLDPWVGQGFNEFNKRMPPECRVNLVEIAPPKRTKNSDLKRIIEEECDRMIAAIPLRTRIFALDSRGKQYSTEELSLLLKSWLSEGSDISLLVGGPDGLSERCRGMAESSISLSRLTFPHPLVRVILAEQLYRAWSILKGHPYHR